MKGSNFGWVLIMSGLTLLGFVVFTNSKFNGFNRPFSAYGMLTSSWEKYKKEYIDESGRVIDKSQGDMTTSEGQSYAMLRAVIIDDKQTFDKVWDWTKVNLKRKNDNLLGWKWGDAPGDDNSASDAEEDIALALIMAGRRWGDENYTEEARKIVVDLWRINTALIGGKRYLMAGNWANTANEIVINPSYFSPYAWREFAKIDKEHDWMGMIDPAYDLLEEVSNNPLSGGKSVGLPPDWVAIDKVSGKIGKPRDKSLSTNYSYDAIRVPFRVGLDYIWNDDQRAYNYLVNSFEHLGKMYEETGRLEASYKHDGGTLSRFESPAMYATAIAYFKISDPKLADKMFEEKIARLYSNDANNFRKDLPYYEQNWLWFGTAFYYGLLRKESV